MQKSNLLPALPALLLLTACAASPAEGLGDPTRPTLHAALAARAPVVDGRADDPVWAWAPVLEVDLTGPTGPTSCQVQGVLHEGRVTLLVRWADPDESREHKPWVRGAEGWAAGPEREDVLAVAFPVEGEFTADMLSPVDAVWDVWQWKAARTDPAGFAMDKSHVNSLSDPGGERHQHILPDGRRLYIARPEDEGRSATLELPRPEVGDRAPRYRAQEPDGSAADVRARGHWADGHWTVELSRALSTGHADDAELAGVRSTPFALAVLDRAEDEDHASSEVLRLVLTEP